MLVDQEQALNTNNVKKDCQAAFDEKDVRTCSR